MTGREWKPGEVGITGGDGVLPQSARFIVTKNGDRLRFQYEDGDTASHPPREDARPLVVIDPESDADVDRLVDLIGTTFPARVRNALREFATPTPIKPEEPQGLGAVVEDEYGTRWSRVESGDAVTRNPWYPANDPDMQPDEWDHIKVTCVLSEGVS